MKITSIYGVIGILLGLLLPEILSIFYSNKVSWLNLIVLVILLLLLCLKVYAGEIKDEGGDSDEQ